MKVIGPYFIENGKLQIRDKNLMQGSNFVYEVLRIIDSVPLYWSDHFNRLVASAGRMQLPVLFSAESLKMEVCSLLEANGLTHTNLLIVLDPRGWCRAYTLETHYPELRAYQEGISVQTVEITRSDPQAKVMKPSQRTLVDGLLATTGMYELLLVNSAGHITEGSRSNVFFVCGNELVTAPESVVLVGITRQYVLHICSTLGLVICEKALTIPEAKLADAAFITGTTPKVMPIRYLNGQQFNHKHPKLLQIMEVYDLYLRDYIANNRRL